MTLGDVLEVIAAGCLIAAGYIWQGPALALGIAGACVAYLAQVHAKTPLSRPRRSAPVEVSETAKQ